MLIFIICNISVWNFRGLQDLLDLLEKKDTLDNQDRWDLQELVESVEKLVLRYRLITQNEASIRLVEIN